MDRKPIELIPGVTKGILVYAKKNKTEFNALMSSSWLILISKVEMSKNGDIELYRHFSYDMERNWCFLDTNCLESKRWGNTIGYDFYEATEEEKKMVVEELSKRYGVKFVKVLNKLVRR